MGGVCQDTDRLGGVMAGVYLYGGGWLFDGGWGSDVVGGVTVVYTHIRWKILHNCHTNILPRMFIIMPYLQLPGNHVIYGTACLSMSSLSWSWRQPQWRTWRHVWTAV